MRTSIRHFPLLLGLLGLLLLAGVLAGVGAPPASAAVTWLPPALYTGGDLILSNTAKITSPLVNGQPSAGLYIKGKFTNTSSGSLSTVKQYLGTAAPALSQFMPDAQFSALVASAQNAASTTATPANTFTGLTYSDAKDHTFMAPVVVNGNLTISGTGTCTFASLCVTGNMVVANAKANVSIAALRVNGTLTASSGSLTRLGPTYVAGATTLTGSGTWNMGLFAAGGNLTIAGSQTFGSVSSPVRILLAGSGKSMTYSCTGTCYGLLANPSGGFSSQTSTGKIVGSVLCSGSASMTNSASIAYDPTVAKVALDFTGPTVAITSPANLSLINNPRPVLSYTLTDAAGGSGLNTTATLVRLDGSVPTFIASGSPLTTTLLPDGTHTVTVTAYDLAGNMGSATSTFSVDTTPPTGTVSINNGDAATSRTAVTLALSATDGGSGVAKMRFSNDNSTWSGWETYATTRSNWTLAGGDGTKTVWAQFQDALGNASAVVIKDTIIVDKTGPTGTVSINGGADWTNTLTATLTLSGTDSGSGVSKMRFSNDNSNWSGWETYATTRSNWTLAGGDGTKTVWAQFQDAAGNTSTTVIKDTITLDTAPPSGTVKINGDAAWTKSTTVTLTPSASDGSGSGLSEMRFSNDNSTWSDWESYATTRNNWTLPSGDSTKTVYVQFKDNVRNPSTATIADSIGLDTTKPTVNNDYNRSWRNGVVFVTLLPQDAGGSGLATTYYKFDDATQYTPGTGFSLDGQSAHAVEYYTTDLAGNQSGHKTLVVKFDATRPTVTSDYDGSWRNGDVKLTLTPVDTGGSGLVTTYYKVDGATDFSEGTSFTVKGQGQHPIEYYTVDVAGNQSAHGHQIVEIDTTAPTVTDTYNGTLGGGVVTFALQPSDEGGSGLDKTYYKIDSAAFTPGEAVTLTAGVPHAVEYFTTDNAGNASTHTTITVRSEGLCPTVTINPRNGSSTAYNRPVFDFSATEASGGSGIAFVSVQVDGQAVAATSGQPLPEPLHNGDHVLTVTARDNANNAGSASYPFTVVASAYTVQPAAPWEGDTIGVYAPTEGTGNPDGSWEGRVWQWRVVKGQFEPVTFEGPYGFATLPGSGDYSIRLTVTDNATGAVCVTDTTVTAEARPPRVDALDVEALDGEPAKLEGRFLDPGWLETHSATWSIDGVEIAGNVREDNLPAMDTGSVAGATAVLSADDAPQECTLTVSDSSGSTSVPFTITVRSKNVADDEGLPGSDVITRPASSPKLHGGQVHLSYIQSANDVDIFEVTTPDGQALSYGTEVLATLGDLPADYDLAVIQDLGEEASPDAAFAGSSFASAYHKGTTSFEDAYHKGTTSYVDAFHKGTSSYQDAYHKGTTPFLPSAYVDAYHKGTTDWVNAYHKGTTDYGDSWVRQPLSSMLFSHTAAPTNDALDGYPFDETSFTGLEDATASGSTLKFEELGFDNEALADMRVAGFSAHSGTEPEVVLARTDFVGGNTYVAIKGANGAFSDEPYSLKIETRLPANTNASLNAGRTEQPKVPDPSTTVTPEYTRSELATPPETLFVTQGERIDAIYGDATLSDDAEGQPWEHIVLPALQDACDSPLVKGEVLSVPGDVYTDWDKTPWNTLLANGVTEKVHEVIQGYLGAHPSIKYVVLVGSDEVIPQRRVQDQTVVGNERAYADNAGLNSDSAVLAAMSDSMILTDDFYVDAQPIPFNGRSLYIPDVAVSRLVETPTEIAGTIEQFLVSRGVLDGGTSFVTGLDFMSDGAEKVYEILKDANLSPAKEVSETWTANDVRQAMLTDSADVTDINAHFTHYGGISADGYWRDRRGEDWTGEFLSSKEIENADEFIGKLVFSMGCHAGLNVPDDQGYEADPDAAVDVRLDIAQAIARQQGVLLASTGFGFGDTEGIAGTEALMGAFADQATTADAAVAAGAQPIGLALAEAKREYLGSLPAVTPYDEKSSIQFTMYGMPQYRLSCTTHDRSESGVQAASVKQPASAGVSRVGDTAPQSTLPTTFTLTVIDGSQSTTYPVQLKDNVAADHTHYISAGVDDETANTIDLPIQPCVSIPLGTGGLNPVKSAIVTDSAYFDIDPFSPTLSEWTNEWQINGVKLRAAPDGWWPADSAMVSTIQGATPEQSDQTLIVLPGRFLATSLPDQPLIGTQRVCTSMTVELARSSLADTIAPTVRSVVLSNVGHDWTATIDAEDASGIGSIDITQQGADGTTPFHFDNLSPTSGTTYQVLFELPNVDAGEVSVVVDVTDGAGNTTEKTGKGLYITGPPTGSATLNNDAVVTYDRVVMLDSDVSHADELRAKQDDGPWSDWQPYAAEVPVTLSDGLGLKTVSIEYRNSSNPQTLSVSDSITLEQITISSPADGSTTANVTPTLQFTVSSPASVMVKVDHIVAEGMLSGDPLGPLSAGSHIVEVIATHSSGVQGSAISTFTVDTIPPTVTITSPADGSTVPTATPQLVFDVGDADPASVVVKVDDIIVSKGSGDNLDALADAWHTVVVSASDAAGNQGTASSTFRVATATPAPAPSPLGTATLNSGAGQTNSSPVTLDLPVAGATEMRTSTDRTSWTAWRPYIASSLVALPGLPAAKTVWVQYRNDGPNMLERSASIGLVTGSTGAGGSHNLSLKSDGSLWAWGDNSNGQVGDNSTTNRLSPTHAGTDTDWVVVSSGGYHSLALKSLGTLWTWGYNSNNQLGDNSTTDSHVPKQVGADTGWTAVSGGSGHSLALRSDGTLWAWGCNTSGQLGDDSLTNRLVPTQIGTDARWIAVSAGGQHSLALRSDGTLWAWGNSSNGQLGDGTVTWRSTPTRIGTDSDWVSVSAGMAFSVALKSDGSLWAWGDNTFGEVGDGTTTARWAPTRVGTDADWVAVAAGYAHSIALKKDRSLWAWGWNGSGQLGDGTTSDRAAPVPVGADMNWLAVSCGNFHSVAVKNDGSVWAWGSNNYGQLGDGTGTSYTPQPEPVFSLTAPGVTNPDGGENWVIGSSYNITWAPCSGGPVDIQLSRNNGGSWETLFASTSNDGSESWTVSGSATNRALVRVSNDAGSDTSNANFTIAMFTANVDYHAGLDPRRVAVGDFNRDGNQDLVAANYQGANVSVLLGNGGGTFAHHVDYTTAADPFRVAVGDFNGDGNLDVVTANAHGYPYNISVLLGNGDGTFRPKVDYESDGPGYCIVAGDFNGDGKQDIAEGANYAQVSVLLGNGSGAFPTHVSYPVGSTPFGIVVGDFDGDGKQDLATANQQAGSVSVLMGSGSGTFVAKPDYSLGIQPQDLAVGDFNGDARQDLVLPNASANSVRILRGDGSGAFAWTNNDYPTGSPYSPQAIAVGDFDNDGNLDVATPDTSYSGVSVLLGRGDASLRPGITYNTDFVPYGVAVSDFNNDGRQDLATANSVGTVSVLLNRPNLSVGSLQFAPYASYAPGYFADGVAVGDFNGDGKQDLVTANPTGHNLGVLLGAGGGTLGSMTTYSIGTSSYPRSVAVGDFNRDGKQDLVAASDLSPGSVSVLLGGGDGSFGTKSDFTTAGHPSFVAVGDFNGDGKQDLVTANYGAGSVSVLLGNGDGTFGTRVDYATAGGPYTVAVGDFNRDGAQDLVTASDTALGISVLLGNDTGGFAAHVEYGTGVGPHYVAVGDFNRDGKQDVATANSSGNSVSMLLGNGSGSFGTEVLYTIGASPNAIVVGDFNRDGEQDLATANNGAGTISVLLGDGSGNFGAKVDYAAGTDGTSVLCLAVGDFDRDGKPDLATGDCASILLNTTSP